jgi:hypothetical protein
MGVRSSGLIGRPERARLSGNSAPFSSSGCPSRRARASRRLADGNLLRAVNGAAKRRRRNAGAALHGWFGRVNRDARREPVGVLGRHQEEAVAGKPHDLRADVVSVGQHDVAAAAYRKLQPAASMTKLGGA